MSTYFRDASLLLLIATSCTRNSAPDRGPLQATPADVSVVIKPTIVTEPVVFDTDDPAIWINAADTAQSLIIGTDKNENGGLYAFGLDGKILKNKTVPLKRPDNVDIEYGLNLNNQPTDIAVTTERMTHKLRIFRLPDMTPVDNGGIEVFVGETGPMQRDLMGVAMYKNPDTGDVSVVVGRKNGPTDGTYLWQYKLQDDGHGAVKATLARKFGKYSGKKEIEAIAVDDQLGYVYYADERVGIRKYYADPAKGNEELALFGTTGFAQDHEGISIFQTDDRAGYILVSDQGANQFFIFTREGEQDRPHDHRLVKTIKVMAQESDGSEVTSLPLNNTFRHGLFVVMSTDRTFHYYRWEDIAGGDLVIPTRSHVEISEGK